MHHYRFAGACLCMAVLENGRGTRVFPPKLCVWELSMPVRTVLHGFADVNCRTHTCMHTHARMRGPQQVFLTCRLESVIARHACLCFICSFTFAVVTLPTSCLTAHRGRYALATDPSLLLLSAASGCAVPHARPMRAAVVRVLRHVSHHVALVRHCSTTAHRTASSRLSVSQRLALLCDPASLRAWPVRADDPTAVRGVTTCTGRVFARPVALVAHESHVRGGALTCEDAHRITGLMDFAADQGMPLVSLSCSSGADIHQGVAALEGVASVLRRHVELSGVVPQVSVVVGPSAGGAAYAAALSDFTFMVEDGGFLFVTGPAVARAVGGATVSMSELGGTDVHARLSGVSSRTFADEVTAMAQVRRFLTYLPGHSGELPPRVPCTETRHRPASILSTVLPRRREEAYDVRDVLEAVLDRGSFFALQPDFAPNIVCGLGRLEGRTVCVIANQPAFQAGVLDSAASVKAARLVRFADAFNIPIITFVDVPGFLPGVHQESGGILRHGAKLLYAYAEATVPRFSVILRKAFGGAYIVMNAKGLGGDRNYAWPNAEIAVMGAHAAASIIGEKGHAQAATATSVSTTAVPESLSGIIDAVLAPEDTRRQLCVDLDGAWGQRRATRRRKHHGSMPL